MAYIVADNKRREEINNNLVEKFHADDDMVENVAVDDFSGEGYVDEKLPYTQTGNLPRNLKVKKNVPIMITVNSINKRYKENGIVNGARGYIVDYELVDVPEKNKIIWVLFPDKETGSYLRDDMRKKGIKHRNELAVPIEEVKKQFQVRGTNIKVRRKQFPMVLCFCMTSYKSQGQTLEAVILDYKNCVSKHGQFYVGMTRVRSSEGLFVRNFDPSQIFCRNDVKRELKILRTSRQYVFYKTFLDDKIWSNDENEIKIGYLNINGLVHNLDNLANDKNLSNLDFLCIAETKLSHHINDNELTGKLENFVIIHREDMLTDGNVPHMGMLILKSKKCKKIEKLVECSVLNLTSRKKLQCAKLTIEDEFSVLFNYVNRTPEKQDMPKISDLFAEKDVTFIVGDFNLNPEKKEEREKINIIEKKTNMTLELEEKTRKNTTLDLLFKKVTEKEEFFTFCFRNMYSDHATVGFRYCNGGIVSGEYSALQIRKQDKAYLRRTTLDVLEGIQLETGKVKIETGKVEREADDGEDDIVVRNRAAIVRESNLRKLSNDDWLDDELINCYLYQLKEKYGTFYQFSTFFHSELQTKALSIVKKKYENINLFDIPLWLIPVNYRNLHWFLLAVDTKKIESKELTIRVYDSLGGQRVQSKGIAEKQLKAFITWKFHKLPLRKTAKLKYSLVNMAGEIPKQRNSIDCGVFVLMYSKYLAAAEEFRFDHRDMRKFRLKIKDEIQMQIIEDVMWDMEEEMEWNEDYCNDSKRTHFDEPRNQRSKGEASERIRKESEAMTLPGPSNQSKGEANERIRKESEAMNLPGPSNRSKGKANERIRDESEAMNLPGPSNAAAKGRSRREPTSSVEGMKSRPSRVRRDRILFQDQHVLRFDNDSASMLCFSNSVTTALLNILKMRRTAQDFASENRFPNAFWRELSRLSVRNQFEFSSTRSFRRTVAEKCLAEGAADDFNNGHQHDAVEFMKYTIEHLFSGVDSLSQLRDEIFTARNQSYLLCTSPRCSNTTQLFVDTEEIFSIAIHGNSLYTCLKKHFDDETIDRDCPEEYCQNVESRKITTYLRFPSDVIFQLKRFDRLQQKIHTPVMIPQQIELETIDEVHKYQVSWFITHIGPNLNSGHYVCYLAEDEEDFFTKIDDETITSSVELSQDILRGVYVISYRRV